MQEIDYNQFKEQISDKFTKHIPIKTAKQVVSEAFNELKVEGKLDCLTPDEINLLEDYRQWKISYNAANGIFHWKKR